jgi:hypothetical protein
VTPPTTNSLQFKIEHAAKLGQSLEDLVSCKALTMKTDRDFLLVGLWSLTFDYSKGILSLLASKYYASAFALWRPLVEAAVRAHLIFIVSDKDFRRIREDKYTVHFSRVGKQIDKAFGLGHLFENFLKEAKTFLHSFSHSGMVALRRRFDGNDVVANYREEEIDALIMNTVTAVFMVTNLVTKHFEIDPRGEADRLLLEYEGQKR